MTPARRANGHRSCDSPPPASAPRWSRRTPHVVFRLSIATSLLPCGTTIPRTWRGGRVRGSRPTRMAPNSARGAGTRCRSAKDTRLLKHLWPDRGRVNRGRSRCCPIRQVSRSCGLSAGQGQATIPSGQVSRLVLAIRRSTARTFGGGQLTCHCRLDLRFPFSLVGVVWRS